MEAEKKDFDLKTHIRDPKSGRVVALNHYRLVITQKDAGGAEALFERPVGSGLWYHSNGELNAEKSKAGVEAVKNAERDAKKTERERAQEEYVLAKKRVEAAEIAYNQEQASLKSGSKAKEGK